MSWSTDVLVHAFCTHLAACIVAFPGRWVHLVHVSRLLQPVVPENWRDRETNQTKIVYRRNVDNLTLFAKSELRFYYDGKWKIFFDENWQLYFDENWKLLLELENYHSVLLKIENIARNYKNYNSVLLKIIFWLKLKIILRWNWRL